NHGHNQYGPRVEILNKADRSSGLGYVCAQGRFSHTSSVHKDPRRQRDLIAGRGMSSIWNFIYRRK
ncbi:hypothetical protein TNIN_217321, partial [Trichonephila inaurata madagascariensis]